ncbi:MAG: hypothetical protein EBU90_18370 [Proteobacteria bacterium]|nr:hypothetical protein [Pseudomonadota bacterium]NBP13037.1 hypothetical protein [bacterium]
MILDYKLNYNHIGEKRKYKLPKKKRLKIIDNSSWSENDLKNQWYFKDYKSFYIVISKFSDQQYKVSCSGASAGEYKDLDAAKVAAIDFCNKIIP